MMEGRSSVIRLTCAFLPSSGRHRNARKVGMTQQLGCGTRAGDGVDMRAEHRIPLLLGSLLNNASSACGSLGVGRASQPGNRPPSDSLI
ncbi:hypothetical protein GWK47_024250 [Chionoecetes opilio]|uniref:Uncharacterized protein n=1 Tax=Chionoecetes opilio TaxID=41210 RepID=A0A8J4XLH4_CHIOP|nr:hypothetical protein GWK47_024250 [Chionoecetes opilio]